MGKTLSEDLRVRVIAAVEGGMSRNPAAERFGNAVATAVRWLRAWRDTLITTTRAFGEWNEVFPNAACVVSLVDRLVHNAEIVAIEGESYRLKEARDRADARARKRRGAKS